MTTRREMHSESTPGLFPGRGGGGFISANISANISPPTQVNKASQLRTPFVSIPRAAIGAVLTSAAVRAAATSLLATAHEFS